MRTLILLLSLLLSYNYLYAQKEDVMFILREVKVKDAVTKDLLDRFNFTVYDTKGKAVKADANKQIHFVNDREVFSGYTIILNSLMDTLIIEAQRDGYEYAEKTVCITEDKLMKAVGNRYFWDEEVLLTTKRMPYKELDEVTVNATRILMVQKGDTLIYNAAALQLSAGSMLNDLVRALPGAQLDSRGKISINGEPVKTLLVNGKDFFKGDPNVALDNLPYYTVDKIKVFRNLGDLRNATHQDSIRAKARNPELTMDVRLKKEYSRGWLANAEVGGGLRTSENKGEVYRGRVFAMMFSDHAKLGIYGTANNVGDNHKPTHNGEWREMQAEGMGEPVIQQGGIDYSVENKDGDLKFETTLDARHETNTVENKSARQQFFDTGDIFSRNSSSNHSNNSSMNWRAGFSKNKRKKYYVSVAPNIHFSKGRNRSTGLSAAFDTDPQDKEMVSSLDSIFYMPHSQSLLQHIMSSQRTISVRKNYFLTTGIQANAGIYLPLTKDNLRFSAGFNYREMESTDIGLSEASRRDLQNYYENYRSQAPHHDLNYNLGVSHKLFSFSNSKAGTFFADLSYSYNHSKANKKENLFKNYEDYSDYIEIEDWNMGKTWPLDSVNSFITDEADDSHNMFLQFSYYSMPNKKQDNVVINLQLPIKYQKRSVDDVRGQSNQQIVRKDWTYSPYFNVRYGNYFSLTYQLQPSLPSLSQMLDVSQSSNSLFVSKGNPDLRTAFTHVLNLSSTTRKPEISQWITANVSGNIIKHEVKQATTYDRNTGVTTWQPRNIEGNWWMMGSISFGRALDKEKRWNLSTDSRYVFAHETVYASDAVALNPHTSLILQNKVIQQLKISYGKGPYRVELFGRVMWNKAKSGRENFQHMNYLDQLYSLTLMTPLVWGISLDTDLRLYLRRGYNQASMNTTEWQWNAALSTRFGGKKKLWTARLVGFDLLQQLSNITHAINAQARNESWHNTIRSYVNLNITYHFEMKPKKSRM